MTGPNQLRRIACWIALVGIVAVGCSDDPTSPHLQSEGRVVLHVDWFAARHLSTSARYIPSYAKSLLIEVHRADDPGYRITRLLNRPEPHTSANQIAIDQLMPVGGYRVAVVARESRDGQGASVASGSTAFTVESGKRFDVRLTLNSTVQELTVVGEPLHVPTGWRHQVRLVATDREGNIFYPNPEGFAWSRVSGIDVNPVAGVLTSDREGMVRIRADEVGAGIGVQVDMNFVPESDPGRLWICTGEGELGIIDVGRQSYLPIGTTRRENGELVVLSDIAWSPGPDAKLFGVGSSEATIFVIDPKTSIIRPFTSCGMTTSALTVGIDRRLYAAGEFLLAIDTTTGACEEVANLGEASGGDMDFGPHDGMLYRASYGRSFYRVDPYSGEQERLGYLSAGYFAAVAVTEGRLIGFAQEEREMGVLDFEDGEWTFLGNLPDEVNGRVYGATAFPR